MQVGLVSLGMARQPLAEVLAAVAEWGAEALELNGRRTVHCGLWDEPVDYRGIAETVAAAGIAVSSLGGYCDLAQPTDEGLAEQVDQFVAYCRAAHELGVRRVRAFVGEPKAGHTLEDLYPRLVAGLRAIVERVAGWGLRVAIENHGRLLHDGTALAALLDEVDSPLLGVTLDTGNFCWAGHTLEEAHAFFEALAPRVVNVHVKDGRFEDGRWVLYPAGRGDIDLAGVLRLLHTRGYVGPVLSEYEGEADFGRSTLESVAYLRGLRDAIAGAP